jgi:hypothetical protein
MDSKMENIFYNTLTLSKARTLTVLGSICYNIEKKCFTLESKFIGCSIKDI